MRLGSPSSLLAHPVRNGPIRRECRFVSAGHVRPQDQFPRVMFLCTAHVLQPGMRDWIESILHKGAQIQWG